MTTKKQLATQFKSGKSGNPKGRPKGAKNKETLLQEVLVTNSTNLMVKSLEKIVKAVIEKANEGDLAAAKMILDRIIPTKKAQDINAANGDGKFIVNVNVEPMSGSVGTTIEATRIDGPVSEDEDGQ